MNTWSFIGWVYNYLDKKMENEIGKRYGKLTVIEKLDRREHNTSVYLCINVTGATLKKLISIIFILATLNRVGVLKIESKI